MPEMKEFMELVSMGIEILAVIIMVLFIVIGTVRWVAQSARDIRGAYGGYRLALGKTILIGLELLVAADIIRTVALDATPKSLGVLAGLVAVRIFLGWSIVVEIEGRWPWQKEEEQDPAAGLEEPRHEAA